MIDLLIVACIGLAVQAFFAARLSHPTYMDAYYYATNGQRLASGHGFSEMVIWQYLDKPQGLPAPSHTYWMPLPSLLAAIGYLISNTFRGGQLIFWLLAGLLPALSYGISRILSTGRLVAWAAALFTAAGSFYSAFLNQPTTFAPFAWAGSLCLLFLGLAAVRYRPKVAGGGSPDFLKSLLFWLCGGVMAGIAHLTRADGLLFVVTGLVVWGYTIFAELRERAVKLNVRSVLTPLMLFLLGYLLVMGWWFARNLSVKGTILSAAGAQSPFLTTYDDLFAYGRSFSLSTYLDWGWANILRSKFSGLWSAVQTYVTVTWLIFLSPFVVVASVKMVREQANRRILFPAATYFFLVLFGLSLVFTLPAIRGSLFHSSIALWPWSTALAAAGIGYVVDWTARRRQHWEPEKAKRNFTAIFVLIAFAVSLFVSLPRAESGADVEIYKEIEARVPANAVVMAGNAPAFHYHTGLPSISVPNEPPDVLLEAAGRYGAGYLLLDENRPLPLDPLYSGQETDSSIELLFNEGEIRLYRLHPNPESESLSE